MVDFEKYLLSNNIDKIKSKITDLKVIYTDVDGTLLGPRGSIFNSPDGHLTFYPAKALIRALEANVDVVMISGRSSRQLFGDARVLSLKNYIAELGCQLVYDLGKKVITDNGNFPVGNGKTLHQSITDTGAPKLLLETFASRFEYHTPWSENRECTHVFRGLIDLKEANEILENNGLSGLQIIDNGIISRRGGLEANLPEIHAYHLLPKGVGKETGLRKDLENRNLKKSEVIAIGDALSDLSLADEAGALFLVKNAFSEHSKEINNFTQKQNVFVTNEQMGLGFAELVFAFLGY